LKAAGGELFRAGAPYCGAGWTSSRVKKFVWPRILPAATSNV
jgi:hypothetical protein